MQKQMTLRLEERAGKCTERTSGRLNERDRDIVRFLLQMKFSAIEEIHQKFFRWTLAGRESHSLRWARERMNHLKGLGLVTTTSVAASAKQFFVASWKGYQLVLQDARFDSCPKPNGRIDIRTFNHDQVVLRTRLEFEEQNQITNWLSDIELRSGLTEFTALRGEFAPDGIFWTAEGSAVALEVEIATKAKDRYRKKIAHYVDTLRSTELNCSRLSKVHVICLRRAAFEFWTSECRIYPNYFLIELRQPDEQIVAGVA